MRSFTQSSEGECAMRKALIITCNDRYDYNTRTKYVEAVLKANGYMVEHLLSDFDHRSKKTYKAERSGTIHYLHVPAYSKNLSIKRIWSHIRFGQQVKDFVDSADYDLLYHCAPPNYTIMKLSKSKKKKDFKLITEIGDMWPESIPMGKGLKRVLRIPFSIWARFRDKFLYNSDSVIAECDLFRDTIKQNSGIDHVQTLYFCKEFTGIGRALSYTPGEVVSLCYLGSINNIIDVDMIGKVLQTMTERVSVIFHIIGDGENRQTLVDVAEKSGAKIHYWGMVYDEGVKKSIFDKCHYALNIMKPEVFVGMTMKSLDYFSAGIPLINNIGGDIWKIVDAEKVGINISVDDYKEQISGLLDLTPEQYRNLCDNVKETHRKHFSIDCVSETISSLL